MPTRNRSLPCSVATAVLLLVAAPSVAAAQPAEPARPAAATGDAPAAPGDLKPPTLERRGEATYPEDAKRERLEANVGLELVIDEEGRVVDAKVTTPVGHGFDEAALAAARTFVFAPARQGDKPIRSSVQFTYEFHLPPEPVAPSPPVPVPVPAPAPAPIPGEVRQNGADQSSLVLAQRPISAASSSSVRDRDT